MKKNDFLAVLNIERTNDMRPKYPNLADELTEEIANLYTKKCNQKLTEKQIDSISDILYGTLYFEERQQTTFRCEDELFNAMIEADKDKHTHCMWVRCKTEKEDKEMHKKLKKRLDALNEQLDREENEKPKNP